MYFIPCCALFLPIWRTLFPTGCTSVPATSRSATSSSTGSARRNRRVALDRGETAVMTEPTELRTERLLLRPFKLEDVADVYVYAKDPEWAQYLLLPIPQPYTRRNAEEFVARQVLADWSTNPDFAIVLKSVVVGGHQLENRRYARYCGIRLRPSESPLGEGVGGGGSEGGNRLGVRGIWVGKDLRPCRLAESEINESNGEGEYDPRGSPAQPSKGARRADRRSVLRSSPPGVGTAESRMSIIHWPSPTSLPASARQ